eukprot:360178-Chlamydomonas_euryale.AAC.5
MCVLQELVSPHPAPWVAGDALLHSPKTVRPTDCSPTDHQRYMASEVRLTFLSPLWASWCLGSICSKVRCNSRAVHILPTIERRLLPRNKPSVSLRISSLYDRAITASLHYAGAMPNSHAKIYNP